MPSIAVPAIGTLYKVSDGGGTPVFNTIPEVMDVNAPDIKFDLQDVTSHDSTGGYREFLPGLVDGESVTAPINWVPTNTIHIQIRVDALARTRRAQEITFPIVGTGNKVAFGAYFIGLAPQAKAGDPLKATVNAKVTGAPTWT
jgi:hypothetical protein